MPANPKDVAANIRTATEAVHDATLQGYMAEAAAEELARAWDSYDASVSTRTIASDVEVVCEMLREIAGRATAASGAYEHERIRASTTPREVERGD